MKSPLEAFPVRKRCSGSESRGKLAVVIDTSFDFRSDAGGKDPDSYSATLRRYHQVLWSKPLPSGLPFDLSVTQPGAYLYHRSDLGEFVLASDSVIPTFGRWKRLSPIIEQIPKRETEAFRALSYTIGAMMVFPGNRVEGKATINGARGFNVRIADRLDLTLECIRRHYLHLESPLADTLALYSDFFSLFGDFSGYVDFFLLDDLVTLDQEVRFHLPFEDCRTSAYPRDLASYLDYRRSSIEFIEARNRRIRALYD